MKEVKINCPLAVYLPRKTMKDKRISVNLNVYRNLNPFSNNAAKKIFAEEINKYIAGKTIDTPVEITYQVFKPTKRKLDKMNVVAIVSKYLLDAITEAGCWPDDNDDYVLTETLLPTQLDKENPRCEVTIKTVEHDKVGPRIRPSL